MARPSSWVNTMSTVIGVLPPVSDLDALFRRYHRDLTAYAYCKLRDRDAAADVVQDAFLRYLQRDGRGEDALQPGLFLKRVVGNLTIDVGRQSRRRGTTVPIDAVAEHLADPAPSAERAIIARQDYARLKRALDALPLPVRAALLLSRVEGLTHAEIAAHVGISGSLVSRHIVCGLRHCLKQMGGP